MSLPGKGRVDFCDDADPAERAPRKGVVDFGYEESPEPIRAVNRGRLRSEEEPVGRGGRRFADINACSVLFCFL